MIFILLGCVLLLGALKEDDVIAGTEGYPGLWRTPSVGPLHGFGSNYNAFVKFHFDKQSLSNL